MRTSIILLALSALIGSSIAKDIPSARPSESSNITSTASATGINAPAYPVVNGTATAFSNSSITTSSPTTLTALPSFSNSTMTAIATTLATTDEILAASGTPKVPINTVTSMYIVTPSVVVTATGAASASATSSSSAVVQVKPRYALGLLALGITLLC